MIDPTFAQMRQWLGLGPRGLKVLLWLRAHDAELESGDGQVLIHVGGNSVKAAWHPTPVEVRMDEVSSGRESPAA